MITTIIIIVSILLLYILLRVLVVIHLIYVYSKTIKELPEDSEKAYKYLSSKHLDRGICFYCSYKPAFLLFIGWISKYSPLKKTYWYEPPYFYYNSAEMMKKLLILRRDKLIYVLKRLTIFK